MSSHRQVQLQTIIKTQESKIHALKKELSVLQKQEQDKIAEAINRERKVIEEKDKTIKIMMEETKKAREDNKHAFSERMNEMEGLYRSTQQTMLRQRRMSNEFETKILKLSEDYEAGLRQKESEKQELAYQIDRLQKERKILLDEIQKLNKFYAQSIRKQPERQQTLLWVDKLIEFISKTNQIVNNESKERQQALLSITLHITHELKQLNMEYSKNDTVIASERLKFLEQLQIMIHNVQCDYKDAMKSNVDFGQNISKVRAREEKQAVIKLQNQLLSLQQSKEKEVNDLYELINAAEKEKKNLLINLQELKSYYELREKACKEEVDFFKKALEDLIESQDMREKEFQKELSRMGEQVHHLTVKFYEKVELPINAVYIKIKEEVEKFKRHFQGFFSDSNLQKQLQQFQLSIVQYLTELNSQKQEREIIKATAKQALKIIDFISSSPPFGEADITQRINPFSAINFHSVPSPESKEQEKRLTYQLATARKQIQKLREQNKVLEHKSPKSKAENSLLSSKAIQLAAENEILRQRLQKLQRNQRDNFFYNEQILTESRIGRVNTALLETLNEKLQDILSFTNKEENYIKALSNCINSLNQIIISPVDTFQQLLNQIKSIESLAHFPQRGQFKEELPSFSEMQMKKETYKDILSRNKEAGANIQKTNLQLMKIIRELLGKGTSSKCFKLSETHPEAERPKYQQSRQMLEKRTKELHAQRLKIREQMLQKLNLLEQKMRIMETRSSKKQNFPFIRFEESICKKLQEFFSSLTPKEKLKDIQKIVKDALSDAKSKLMDCQLQNQGLLKQIAMLKQIKGSK